MVVDTGCNRTLLTDDFRKFVVGKAYGGGGTKVELGGKGQELHVSPLRDVLLPVRDVHGNVRFMKEKGAFSSSVRYPLLACADRPVALMMPDQTEVVQAVDSKGCKFWVPVHRDGNIPVISIASRAELVKGLAARAWTSCEEAMANKDKMTEDEKAELLQVLHKRLAHATGRRLYLTLKEKGWGLLFTEKECGEVQCEACRLLNRRRVKVPRVKDALREAIGPGDEAYQDLIELPKGVAGSRYVSVIIDAHTRRVSAMALKSKDDALVHCIAYVRGLQREGTPVKHWRSDNGGEFVNALYKEFFLKEGIAHECGAPYTPQSQGLVERANGVFKRLLGKTLRSLGLPVYVWPALVPGVVAAMNGAVHAVLGQSAYKKAGDKRADSVPMLALGDVVSVMDPKDKQAVEGYYGGQTSDQVVSVVVKPKGGGWRVMKVHPSALKLVAWQGRGSPQRADGTRQGADATDQMESRTDAAEYEEIDADVYCDDGPLGEEEPALTIVEQGLEDDDEKIIAPGYCVVIEREGKDPDVAQVIKAYKKTLHAARLTKDEGKWSQSELISVERAKVAHSFPMSGGEVPAAVEALLHGNEAADAKPMDSKARAEGAEASDQEQLKDTAAVVEDVPEHVDPDPDEATMLATLALGVRAAELTENKAKNQLEATKEEIARGSHREADMSELRRYAELRVLGPRVKHVTAAIRARLFPAGWRRTWKGEGDHREPKSRLYARGNLDKRDKGWIETYSGTMDAGLMRLAMVYGLERRWGVAKGDVKTAFLQTDSTSELCLRLPDDLPKEAILLGFEPGGVYPMLKAVYGLAESPKLFTDAYKKAAAELGWDEAAQSIMVHDGEAGSKCVEGLMLMHMDDMFNIADKPKATLEALDQKFTMGTIEEPKAGETMTYTGLDIAWDGKKGSCSIGQKRYAAAIKTELSDKERKRIFSAADLKLTEPNEIDKKYEGAQQAWTGVLGWLAKTQRHLSVVFGDISRNNTRPSRSSVVSAMRACEYAKLTHTPLVLEAVKKPALVFWVDASYNVTTCDGRLGWEVQIVEADSIGDDVAAITENNVLAWRSRRCERKLASTTSAELMALLEGVKLAPAYVKLVERLWGSKPRVVFVTDNQPLLAWLQTGWVQTDPAVQGVCDLVRERIHDMCAEVLWVATSKQRADKHTKFIPVRVIR